MSDIHQFCYYGHGSFCLWRRWDTLYTSSFTSYIIFVHNGPNGAYRSIALQQVTSLRRCAQAIRRYCVILVVYCHRQWHVPSCKGCWLPAAEPAVHHCFVAIGIIIMTMFLSMMMNVVLIFCIKYELRL